ncbi:MAG: YbaK/EbsC family protein [bacterium]
MDRYAQELKNYIISGSIEADHLVFQQSCHSVEEAAQAAQVKPEDFVKNICLIDADGNLIVAIVKGEDRVSTKRVGKALGIAPPKVATPEQILAKSGYPCGGVPSFGYKARFLIDPKVLEKDVVYTGGGSDNSLVRIAPDKLIAANNGTIVRVRK